MNLTPSSYDETSSAQQVSLGKGLFDPRGNRVFHYAQAGGSDLARGKITVGASQEGNHTDMSFTSAPAVGDKDVTVTLGATAASADDYKDGFLVVQDGTGEGRAYAVEGHAAADSAGDLEVRLKESIDTAGAVSESNVDLIKNLYKDIVISVADQADAVVGVPVVAISTTEYGWVQTWGPCAVWQDENIAVGAAVVVGSSTVGQVEAEDAAGEYEIGQMGPHTGVDTEYQLMYLKLDPLF